jgi:DNA-binding IclR family transcriptional regulator
MTVPDERIPTAPGGIAAVDRAWLVLQALERADDGARLTDLVRETGLAVASLSRLLVSLERAGLARRRPDRRFALGPALLRLGMAYRRSLRLEPLVAPLLAELGAATQDAASFSVRDGAHRLCLFRVESTLPLRESVSAGDRLSLGVGAPSRVLRAFSESDPRDDEVRARGWVASLGERVPELAAVAAPVFGLAGATPAGAGATPAGVRATPEGVRATPEGVALVGALSLSGLRSRFEGPGLERRRELVVAAAQQLSASLGAPRGTESPS